MILEASIAVLIAGVFLILFSGILMGLQIVKDGRRWKDKVVIMLGICIITVILGTLLFLIHVILAVLWGVSI